MGVFGTLGVEAPIESGEIAIQRVETSMFVIFENYNLGYAMSIIAIVLLFTFFITSADSATYVLGMIVYNGSLEVKSWVKVLLGAIQSALTLVLLFAGGLSMVQNASIVVALPFGFVMLFGVIGFMKEMKKIEAKVLIDDIKLDVEISTEEDEEL